MPKQLISPNRPIVKTASNWISRLAEWKTKNQVGYLIFFIPLDENGYPSESDNWRVLIGMRVYNLDIYGFQPVFRLVNAVLSGEYQATEDMDCTQPVKVLTA